MFVVLAFTDGVLVAPWPRRTTNRLPDLSIIAPGRCAARMPGTGPSRRSSVPARKKAIVGKSRVEPDRLQRPSFVFLLLVIGLIATPLGGRQKVSQLSLAVLSKGFHVQVAGRLKPIFVDLHSQCPQQT